MRRALLHGRRCEVLSPDGLVVYDLRAGTLDFDLQDYGFWLVQEGRCKLGSAYSQILNLISFREYLHQKAVTLSTVTSKSLKSYRSKAVQDVMKSRISKGDRVAAENTVDEKLRNIYKWMLWLQTTGRVPSNTIGPSGCRVLCRVSSLTELTEVRRGRAVSLVPLYPLLFKRGGTARYRSKAVVSRADHEKLLTQFMDSAQSEYVRRRNALIADIGAEVGFRRDSICSLQVAQFADYASSDSPALQAETVEVRPARQKRGYKNVFDFPSWLAVEVAAFIAGPRRDLLSALGLREDPNQSIFLSEKTGMALQARSVTRIFSTAMRALGRAPGTSVHALRRLFAIEAIEQEIDERIERGLSTDTESVCRAVALKMGHADWLSLTHYVSQVKKTVEAGVTRKEERRLSEARRTKAEALEAENESLKAALAEAHRRLDAMSPEPGKSP